MSNEQVIEELLYEAHAYGLRTEVIESARKYREENPRMSMAESYQLAFDEWVK